MGVNEKMQVVVKGKTFEVSLRVVVPKFAGGDVVSVKTTDGTNRYGIVDVLKMINGKRTVRLRTSHQILNVVVRDSLCSLYVPLQASVELFVYE